MVIAGVVIVATSSPVWAHIELADSDPQNVSTVAEPVEQIRLTFTNDADPALDQFAIEGPDGNAVPLVSVEPAGDGSTLIVTPAHPLAGGRHRVSWAIRSSDTHTMNGTVAFTVTAPALALSGGGAAGQSGTVTMNAGPIVGASATRCVTNAEGRDGAEAPDVMVNEAMTAFDRLLRS